MFGPFCVCFSLICNHLPAGIVARQPLSTFMAVSATATGVRTSSHAAEKSHHETPTTKKKLEDDVHSEGLKPTFGAACHGALEGAGDRLPGFLLSRSLFQRHTVDQLTSGRWHLSSKQRELNKHTHNNQGEYKSREWK